jgi:uncharacterized membrane protein (DUF106 family)
MLANRKGRYALPYFQNLFEDFVFEMTLSQVNFLHWIGLYSLCSVVFSKALQEQ